MQNSSSFIIILIAMGFGIYMRIKRSIGFRPYKKMTLYTRITLYVLVLIVTCGVSIAFHPETLINAVIGCVLGLGLAYLGARHAIFENRNDGLYYRTHIWIEIGVLILFVVRIAYRFYIIYGTMGNMKDMQSPDQLQTIKDPLTGLVISIFCAYYIGYFASIIKQASVINKSNNIQ